MTRGFRVTTLGQSPRLTGTTTIGGIPVTGTPGDGDTVIYDITTNTWIIEAPPGSPSASMVPTYIGPTETFTVPANRQALYAMTIDCEGILDVEGYLLEVA